MTPKPRRGTPNGDATLAIQKLARETGADVQELQTLYVLEALLAGIAASTHRDDFVLKGGVLLAAFVARRPTKDIDLQATGFSNDVADVAERLRAIAAIELVDGVVFDADSITASAIRDGVPDKYAGIRVRLVGRSVALGRARLTVGKCPNDIRRADIGARSNGETAGPTEAPGPCKQWINQDDWRETSRTRPRFTV